jgi:pilus assembly protein CpaB
VEGRVALSPIASGEPILFNKLAPVGTAAGLSGLMSEDKRAFTVRVDDVSGVAGFIHPGDKVDVLADMKMRGVEESFSKTILQNIKVLSIGQTWEQRGGDAKPAVVNTVTLELSPQQSELLNLASNEGKIRLVLRGRRNEAIVQTEGVATSALFGMARKEEPKEIPKEEKKEEKGIQLIKGVEVSKTEPLEQGDIARVEVGFAAKDGVRLQMVKPVEKEDVVKVSRRLDHRLAARP